MGAQFATGFVTLRKYLSWAHREGCRIQTGFMVSPDGESISYVVVSAPEPSKRYAVIEDVGMDEALPLRIWQHYDRRLGLVSPFGQTQH